MTILENEQNPFYCVAYPRIFEVSKEALASDSMKINHKLTLWMQLTEPKPEDMLIVTFPWGEKSTDFTGKEWAQAINGRASSDWNINEADNPAWGRHWIVKPVRQEKKVEIIFENINFLMEGISCVMLIYQKEAKEGGKQDFCYRIPILKKSQSLKILEFEAKKRTIRPGEGVKISWKVTGAESLFLNPGNIPLTYAGTKTVYTNRSMVYILCARRQEQVITKELEIYVGGDALDLG